MSDRPDLLLIEDIYECISRIYQYTDSLEQSLFLSDIKTQDAVVRNFEVIGEASSRMTQEFKTSNNHINWRLLADCRNKLIHAYEMIDYELIWNSITERLPFIKLRLRNC